MLSLVEQRREELLGKEFETKNFGKCFITDYKGNRDVTVMFYEPKAIVKCQLGALNDGLVKNPYYPSFYGVGYMGVGKYSGKDKEAYGRWTSILGRAYCEKYKKRFPAYRDVTVCKEWHNFQNFAEWYYSQKFSTTKVVGGRNYHLDKDLLQKGSKVYSPETCCFIPSEINNLITTNKSRRGKYPIGVCYHKTAKVFVAAINREKGTKNLGRFTNPTEAFNVYKKAKEAYIKEVAEIWKDRIDERVYQALLKYEVHIDD